MSHLQPSRRAFVRLLGGAGAALALGAGTEWLARPAEIGRMLHSRLPLPKPFAVPLPVPPVARPTSDATTDYYDLTQRVATQEILPGRATEIWGYDGRFPGPTIVARAGRRTVVTHRNDLPVPTVVHLHGGHTPAAHDGYPTDLIMPRAGFATSMGSMGSMGGDDPRAVITQGTRTYEYPLRQRAATLWYHDHRMGFTGASVWRGLAGFFIVRDAEEEALPLPAGVRDIPLMIADRAFEVDGSLRYPAKDKKMMHIPGVEAGFREGVLGDVILVNGAPWPFLEVDAARYRLRVLNISNARRYRLALSPPPPGGSGLVQIGSDGGLLSGPIAHDAIEVAPAQRYDIVIDFSRYRVGDQVTLINQFGSGSTSRVMRFQVVRPSRDDSHVPARLSHIEPLRADQAVTTRSFDFRDGGDKGWTINGRTFDPAHIDARPHLGELEIWRFNTDFHHPIHLHLAHFQVLSRNGEGPGPYDAGWKDTIDLRPSEQGAILVRFTDYPGRFLFHCHNLEHEDMAMMANFET